MNSCLSRFSAPGMSLRVHGHPFYDAISTPAPTGRTGARSMCGKCSCASSDSWQKGSLRRYECSPYLVSAIGNTTHARAGVDHGQPPHSAPVPALRQKRERLWRRKRNKKVAIQPRLRRLMGAHLAMALGRVWRIGLPSWRREKDQRRIPAQPSAPRPMRVYLPVTACHALLCPHLLMATRGPQGNLSSPRVLHS
jgi:hypothetical protein